MTAETRKLENAKHEKDRRLFFVSSCLRVCVVSARLRPKTDIIPAEILTMRHYAIAFAAALLVALTLPLVAQRGAPPKDEPMPRLADGAPNLGRVGAEKGVWGGRWIRNMGQRIERTEAISDLPSAGGRVGLVGHDMNKDGSKFEPLVPFMDWSRAVYDYHVANESKYDPEGYCLPPGGPRL